MKCSSCGDRAVSSNPRYCKDHFTDHIEEKVKDTIRRFGLFRKKDRIIVAVSGGKDSLTLLHILKKQGYSVSALSIDEGIPGYRDKTLETMKKYCSRNGVSYRIVKFKEEFNITLSEAVNRKKMHPCSICGVFRRYLLNKHAKGYDAITTGHNLDDEAQSVIMNIAKNNMPALYRSGPISRGKHRNFTPRAKPLFFCSDKDVMTYSFINDITTDFNECPFVAQSFRLRVRDNLNIIESQCPGSKRRILEWTIGLKRPTAQKDRFCIRCGEYSANEICKACEMIKCL